MITVENQDRNEEILELFLTLATSLFSALRFLSAPSLVLLLSSSLAPV